MRTSTLLTAFCLLVILFTQKVNAQVAPFITTTWNQTCYYNDSCPVVGAGGSCGRAYTGCNATAMAMICKYYAWPASGTGSHCNSNLPTQCINFSTQTYNYAAMPNNVTSANAEVAKLMWHLGAACDMQYSGTSSNSFFSSEVLKRYFWYSPRLYSTATFMFPTTQELIDAIKLELDAGRPVFAKGGNHFYLIDGYDASDNFHMNFGWSGTYNNYYAINSVVNPAGTFTPGNFMFMIRPLAGDLETAVDTIVVAASGSSVTAFEFTSTLNWTASSPDSWITPNLTSGSPGYFAYADGATFTTPPNNGPVRYGYIYVQNANDIDTIVVQQDASPLGVTPDTLNYADVGGGQNAAITFYSWSTWSASTPDSWITIAPTSGTGNGNPLITAALNPSASPRLGYVAIAGGVFRDTVWIYQDGNTLGITFAEGQKLILSPNPASDQLIFSGIPLEEKYTLTIYTITGEILAERNMQLGEKIIDVSELPNGIFLILLNGETFRHEERVVITGNRN